MNQPELTAADKTSNKYISIPLSDYLLVNKEIRPGREVVFSVVFKSVKGVGMHMDIKTYTGIEYKTVSNVIRTPNGFSGETKDGETISVSEDSAMINVPICILKDIL